MRHEGTSSWFSTSLIPILQRARFLTKNSGQSRCGRNKNHSVHIASDELPFQDLEEMRERKAEMSYGKCQLDSHTTLSAGLPPSWSTAPVAGRLFDGIYYGKYQSSKRS